MTTLTYRPELAVALADAPGQSGLTEDARRELGRISEQINALIMPLTRVRSLPEAERLAASAVSDHIELATQGTQILSDAGELRTGSGVVTSLFDSTHESPWLGEEVKEQLHGTLESLAAYVDWFWSNNATADKNRQRTAAGIVKQVQYPIAQAVMALSALALLLTGKADALPEVIPVLADLADHCMTEVEDAFLGLVEHGDSEDAVPLSEVKAKLGL